MTFYFYLTIAVLISFVLICRSVTTCIHEFGHGLAALLVTKGPVTIFIGSMGKVETSQHYSLGRLNIYHRFSFWHSRGGLCVPGYTNSLAAQCFYILMGPLSTLLVAVGIVILALSAGMHDIGIVFAFLFLTSSIYDLWINLKPSPHPIKLANEKVTYNDGQILLNIIESRKFSPGLRKGFYLYAKQDYDEALSLFEQAYSNGERHPDLLNHLLSLYVNTCNGTKGLSLYNAEKEYFEPVQEFRLYLGVFLGMTGNYEKAMKEFADILYEQPDSAEVRVNRGFTLNLMGKFEEAIIDFDKALSLSGPNSYAYSNRALAYAQLNNLEAAKKDLEEALNLDPVNSYCYLTEGIIHLKKGNQIEACISFERAKALNPYTFSLEGYLDANCA